MKKLAVENKKNKKLDWIIYFMALVSLVLMIIVIVTNRETFLSVEEGKSLIQDKTIAEKLEEKKTMVPEKIKEVNKEETAEKKSEQELIGELATKEKKGKIIKSYNQRILNRYPVQPDKDLFIVSEYKVKRGDALWKIANQFSVKTINLVAVNTGLQNPDLIYPGQTILIPNK